jgi:hydroxyacylglutathione hydrolase
MRRFAILVVLVGCSGNPSGGTPGDDAPPPPKDGSTNPDGPDGNGGLVPGTLTVSWMHGSQNCAQNTDPEVQVHAYNATTHIIRQNKCRTFEAPFIFVLQGTTQALVLDTGATNTATIRNTARGLVGTKQMIVAHTHAHGDHRASDSQFAGQAMTTLVAANRAAVEAAFGIAPWPTDEGSLDLGGRILDVLAIPGHEAQHIAIYDRQTGLLLTGDSLYPGLLFINNWNEYRTSIRRLAQFISTRQVSHVLGAHIEMTATPKVVYPYGTTYQPNEHVLQLGALHVTELDTALTALGPTPPAAPIAHDDFVIDPP